MRSFSLLSFLVLPLTSLCALKARSTACNNSPDLCSKSYGEITHLGAHDSSFLRDSSTDFSTSGNQYYNTTVQLSAGVRLVTTQLHNNNGAIHLCHSSCDLLDAGTLESWLSEIKTWLDSNPNEGETHYSIPYLYIIDKTDQSAALVITVLLVNSDDFDATDLNSAFEAADIVKYAYTPSSTSAMATWPTLHELISLGTRMMTFVASLSSNSGATYLMDEFTYIFETPFEVTAASNFSCQPNRPSSVENDIASALSSNRLPFMNHFLDTSESFGIEIPDASAAGTTNALNGGTGNLGDAAATCKSSYSDRQPTFILVDFFDQGPAIDTVDKLNNVTNPVGRTAVPNTNSEAGGSDSSSGGSSGLSELVANVKAGSTPSLGNWIWVGGDWGSLGNGGISI